MINIIVAVAQNGVIGCHNRLIWHISEDLKRFKALTTGHPVVMGRKTYESIGRALPNRRNIVISRNTELKIEGVEVVDSLEKAIAMCGAEDLFVIGGGEIYRAALPIADRLYLTQVAQSPDGDTFFPEINSGQWREVACHKYEGYQFIDYVRENKK